MASEVELPEPEGMHRKYEVQRVNDPHGKHEDCTYFVMDPRHDRLAYRAMCRYASLARQEGRTELADDIMKWLKEVDAQIRGGLDEAVSSLKDRIQQLQIDEVMGKFDE